MRLTRLTERSQFLAAASDGRRFRTSGFTAQVRDRSGDETLAEAARARPGDTELRLGLTASRHVGNAPVRSRIRRRLRAAAREALRQAAGQRVDLVLVARREVLGLPFGRLTADIAASLSRARPVAAKTSTAKMSPDKMPPADRSARTSPANMQSGGKSPVQPDQKR